MKPLYLTVMAIILSSSLTLAVKPENVKFICKPAEKKVVVSFGSKFFTSCIYPIYSTLGKIIISRYPQNPRPSERSFYHHNVGLWFNFGDANRLEFRNNAFAIKPDDKHRYCSIKFKKIVETNPKNGLLVTAFDCVDAYNKVVFNDKTIFVFIEKNGIRLNVPKTELIARKEDTFIENKGRLSGLHMACAFEEPADRPEIFLDANGNVTEAPGLNNVANSICHNAEGISCGVWRKRSLWVALTVSMQEGMAILPPVTLCCI